MTGYGPPASGRVWNTSPAVGRHAGAFVAKLSARTTDQAIDDAEKLLGTLTPENRRARGAGYGGGGGQDGGNHGGS